MTISTNGELHTASDGLGVPRGSIPVTIIGAAASASAAVSVKGSVISAFASFTRPADTTAYASGVEVECELLGTTA